VSDLGAPVQPLPAALTTRPTRRPDVQGLRAVAVLAVVAFHAGLPVPGGFVGVDIFFVISGFVITLMLARDWRSTGRIRLGTFYRRRFLRLAPAMALMVAVTVVCSAFVLAPFGAQVRTAQTAIGAEFSVANFVIAFTTGGYFDLVAAVNPLLHTWSLSVEEQFYFVFPTLILLAWLAGRRLRRPVLVPVAVLVACCLVSFALALLGTTGWTPRLGASLLSFYSPFTRAWEFGAGAVLALLAGRLARTPRWLASAASLSGVVLVIASFWLISYSTPFPGPWTVLPVAGASLILAAGCAGPTRVSRLLAGKAPVLIGGWSYSIYLWHWPFIVFATLLWPRFPMISLLAATVSVIPALVSFRFVEQPIRDWRAVSRRALVVVVAVTVIPPVVLALGLKAGDEHGWGNRIIQEGMELQAHKGSGLTTDCMNFLTIKGLQPAKLESCVFNGEATGAPIYLVGDSNAAMQYRGIVTAAEQLGRPLYVSTAADCPYSDIYRESRWGTVADVACRAYYEDTLAWLTTAPSGTVVIAGSIKYGIDSAYLIGTGGSSNEGEGVARAANLEAGLRSATLALQGAGQGVVLVEPTFGFESWASPITVDRCSTLSILRGGCPIRLPMASLDAWQRDERDRVRRVAADTSAGLVDLAPFQCPAGDCTDRFGSTPVYDDPSHISAALSEKTAPEFVKALSAPQRHEAG
jgi:peptidoglycan/LPS O-acetylase OafA/YrhL